jgi:hypothetical protein
VTADENKAAVAVWINRYGKCRRQQYDQLAGALGEVGDARPPGRKPGTRRKARKRTSRS